MKVIYSFMIGLILFNFYACTKQTYEPTNQYELEIAYLDENDNIVENKTDIMMMKLKDDDSGFVITSKKINESKYTVYLIDPKSETTISMVYTNGANFPYKITTLKGKQFLEGYTGEHRRDTEDFDMHWYMGDEEDNLLNIPLKNDIYNHVNSAGLDAQSDYQFMIMKISIKIWYAISIHVQNSTDSDNSGIQSRGWLKTLGYILLGLVVPILVIAAAVCSVVAPAAVYPLVKTIGAVITVGVAMVGVDELMKKDKEKRILNVGINETVVDKGYVLNLKKDEIKELMVNATAATINDICIKAILEGDESSTAREVNDYFEFKDRNGETRYVDYGNYHIVPRFSLSSNQASFLEIKKRKEFDPDIYPIYIRILVKEDVYFNNKDIGREFRIKLE